MGRNRMPRCGMDFDSPKLNAAAVLIGVSFFARVAYYFGISGLQNNGFGTLLLFLILPAILELTVIVLVRGVCLNAPMIYAFVGAGYSVLLTIQSFQYDSVLQIILGVAAYLACAVLLVLEVYGIVRRELAAWVLIGVALLRLVIFDIRLYILSFHLAAFLPEAAGLCGLVAFGCLLLSVKPARTRK